jgi:hypothetical protein
MRQVQIQAHDYAVVVGRGAWNPLGYHGMVRVQGAGRYKQASHLSAKQCRRLAAALNQVADEIDIATVQYKLKEHSKK